MELQHDLFDATESERRKREGMAVAEQNRSELLGLARAVARGIANSSGTVHADQVGRVMKARYSIDSLGPAAGSLFKGGDWEWTGEFVKSARVTNHGRLLRVWRLK